MAHIRSAAAIGVMMMFLMVSIVRPQSAGLQTPERHESPDSIATSLIDRFIDYCDLPGFVLAVVKGQELIFSKAIGIQSKDNPSPVTLHTVFSTASVTKLFTATAVMQLYEAGLLEIDSCATKYLPYFRLKDARYASITVREMLSHTSGMPDTEAEEFYNSWAHPTYAEDALEDYVRSLDSVLLVADPGSEYNYSNMAYDVLADLVAKVSGQSFEDYVEQHILEPLEMNNSSVDIREIDPNLLAAPHLLGRDLHFVVSDTVPFSRKHVGCGTLFSSAEDLARFAMWVLQNCHSDTNVILNGSTLRMMWTPVIQWSEKGSQGLGWILWKEGDRTFYEHSGGDPGYRCEFIVIPEDTLAAIALTNSWEHDITPVTLAVVRALLGDGDIDCQENTRGILWKSLRLYGADSAVTKFERIRDNRGTDCLHPAHLNQLADLLIDLGLYEDACRLKEFNASTYSNIPVLKLLLAESYLQADNKPAALEVCREIVRDDPNSERALEIIRELGE